MEKAQTAEWKGGKQREDVVALPKKVFLSNLSVSGFKQKIKWTNSFLVLFASWIWASASKSNAG